jgi:hypothetical protein
MDLSRGVFGKQEHIDLPERAHRALNSLSEMRAFDAQEHDSASAIGLGNRWGGKLARQRVALALRSGRDKSICFPAPQRARPSLGRDKQQPGITKGHPGA